MNALTIGQVAAKIGCNRETIRYYEKERLLPEPGRTEGGHRLYSEELVKRLVFIRRARELGFSMDKVRQLLSIVDRKQVSCGHVKRLTVSHLQDVRAKIKDLRNMERTLSAIFEQCSGENIPDCPIIDVLQNN